MIILAAPDGRTFSAASVSDFIRDVYNDPIASQVTWDEKEGKYILQVWRPGYCICLVMLDEEDPCLPVWTNHPKDCPQQSGDADILCRKCVLSDIYSVIKYDSLEDLF